MTKLITGFNHTYVTVQMSDMGDFSSNIIYIDQPVMFLP